MSKEDNFTNCKQRFKAIEGFLRRVAFNLGNSPSQTEVKIISCIPIDVTDLQQKILHLQKELEQVKNKDSILHLDKNLVKNKESPVKRSTLQIQPAICTATGPTCSARRDESPCKSNADVICKDGSCFNLPVQHLSPFSYACPAELNQNCPYYYSESLSDKTNTEKYSKPDDCCKNFFSKRKKTHKKKNKNQLVYRAQTITKSPFTTYSWSDDRTSKNWPNEVNKSVPLTQSYVADVKKKQYKPPPPPVLNEYSDFSDISSPICRDYVPTCSQYSPYESDACSCCHGQFQNVDNYMNNGNTYNSPVYSTYDNVHNYNRNAYYDSNLYDLVPVKEKAVKLKNDVAIQKRKEPKLPVAVKCWPNKAKPKYRCPPEVINYCNVEPLRDNGVKKFPAKLQTKKDVVVNIMSSQRVDLQLSKRQRNSSKMCYVDIGPVYKKQVIKDDQQKVFSRINKNPNITTCETTANKNAGCPTAVNFAEHPPENKAQTTLSEIKNILQSVLTQVKTCSKSASPPVLPKKDATVQNGPSQGNMYGGSQVLQSFTYSPHDINPYIPSFSRQMPSNNYAYPEMQARCVQQYPLLIQPQKHMCPNCYRNNNFTQCNNTRCSASAATNTEQNQRRSKETELLIKEIYKSIAMNIEIPSQDDPIGEYTKFKPITRDSFNLTNLERDNESKNVAKAISEIFRNTNAEDSSITRHTDTTFTSSKPTSNEVSVESERIKRKHSKAQRMSDYSQNTNSTSDAIDKETEQISRDLESEEHSDTTVVNENSEESTSSSDTISDDVVVEVDETAKTKEKKKEKSGIFKKILNIFHSRQRHRRTENVTKEVKQESESDSDDYQTIYSHKVALPKPKKVAVRSRPHSKVFYSKQPQLKRSRTRSPEKNAKTKPYMEQEYRKYWDESLMFHENQGKRFSTTASRYTDIPRVRPVYYQNYEARSSLVDPIRHVPLRMPGNTLKPSYIPNSCRYPVTNYGENASKFTLNLPYSPSNRVHYIDNIPQYTGRSSYTRNNTNYSGNKTNIKPHFVTSKSNGHRKSMMSAKGLAWLKKHKPALKCGPDWKQLILEG